MNKFVDKILYFCTSLYANFLNCMATGPFIVSLRLLFHNIVSLSREVDQEKYELKIRFLLNNEIFF